MGKQFIMTKKDSEELRKKFKQTGTKKSKTEKEKLESARTLKEEKYKASEKGEKKTKDKRETEEIEARLLLDKKKKEEKALSDPKTDFDRYLKIASDYYTKGYKDKNVKESLPDDPDDPDSPVTDYYSIKSIPRPGEYAEKARKGVQAYTDSMGVAEDAMGAKMRTNQVRELENNFKIMTRDKVKELSQDSRYDMNDPNVHQYIMQQVAYNFVQKYGDDAKKYLDYKNIPVVQ